MRQFISDEEIEKAVHYLAESAKDYAKWKSRMKYLESHRKSIRSAEVLRANGKTISENIHRGEASEAYNEILKEYEEAVYEFTLLDAYRHAAEAKIEAWRTLQASNRRGNL
jgi:histone H3/H4